VLLVVVVEPTIEANDEVLRLFFLKELQVRTAIGIQWDVEIKRVQQGPAYR
jgi:hypothetical protein